MLQKSTESKKQGGAESCENAGNRRTPLYFSKKFESTTGAGTKPAGPAEATINQTVILLSRSPFFFNLLPFFSLSNRDEGKPTNSPRLQRKANRLRVSQGSPQGRRE